MLPFLFLLPAAYLFRSELIFDVLIEERTRRTFAFNIQLKDLPHSRRYIVVAIYIAASELNLHYLFLLVVINAVNGGRLGCEHRL